MTGIASRMIAAALAVLPAASVKAEAIVGNGYACYPNSELYTCKGCTHSAINKWVNGKAVDMTLQQCFDACNATPGCKGVEWVKVHPSAVHFCYLYSAFQSVEYSGPPSSYPDDLHYACLKVPNKGTFNGPPPNETWIPNPPSAPFQDSLRPGPAPGPSPHR